MAKKRKDFLFSLGFDCSCSDSGSDLVLICFLVHRHRVESTLSGSELRGCPQDLLLEGPRSEIHRLRIEEDGVLRGYWYADMVVVE